jgi:hypothetical protein
MAGLRRIRTAVESMAEARHRRTGQGRCRRNAGKAGDAIEEVGGEAEHVAAGSGGEVTETFI